LCRAIFPCYKKYRFFAKRTKEERSELEGKLERMEEKEDSQEVSQSVIADFQKEIPSAAQDEQPP
jgi:hypothetical protein